MPLHQLCRAMVWSEEELPETEQATWTPFTPRCTKDLIEEQLVGQRRDLPGKPLCLESHDLYSVVHWYSLRFPLSSVAFTATGQPRGCLEQSECKGSQRRWLPGLVPYAGRPVIRAGPMAKLTER